MAKKNTETGKQANPEKSASKTKSEKTTATSKKAADQPKTVSAKKKSSKTSNDMPETTVINNVVPYSRFTGFDISLFKSGKHYRLYEKFGSHVVDFNGVIGTYFSVWAPNAQYVSVIANFNGWNRGSHPLNSRWDSSGIWEGFIPNIGDGETYKYFIRSSSGEELEKSDPFALRWEEPPRTASIVGDTFYEWKDTAWMKDRISRQ